MTKKSNNKIKSPKFVLTDESRFYLATKDMTDVDNDDLFFIASLFLPVKKSTIVLQPYTEIAAFDDAESASVYHDVVSKMAQVHSKMEDFGIYKQMIEKFQGNEK